LAAAKLGGKKSRNAGSRKLANPKKGDLDRLLDLDARIVILGLEDQFHRQSEQRTSKLPNESTSRQQPSYFNTPVAYQLVHKDDAADAPRGSLGREDGNACRATNA
jgi:hypothetical protein